MHDDTRIIHAIPTDSLTGAISVPIYQTSTYVQEYPGSHRGFDYGRTANPTRKVLETLLASLERGHAGFAFASGLAAIDAVVKLLRSGDEILCVDDVYGGTFRLFERVFNAFDVRVRYIDTTDSGVVEREISSSTKLVWLESPTNPTLKISDIAEICCIAQAKGALVCVDNTFASPLLQRPIELGADIVVHSATKYLAGHSDVIAGCVVVRSQELAERIQFIQNATGAILGPFDSWLVIRGIETLSLRVDRQCSSALRIAKALQSHKKIAAVHYPGLPEHRNHAVAARQQGGRFGAMISFSLKGDSFDNAARLVSSTKLFKLAESLGGVKSLVSHPASMTHKSIPPETRRRAGVVDSLVRLSVGVEDASDLQSDILDTLDNL